MEIEKTLAIAAPPARVWALLLDPEVMGGCVPGMQSIEVLSPTEYKAVMAVKIAFISAKFRLKTTILEQRAPHYLRCEGTGEDASVASSLKQQSEMVLDEQPDGSTALRMKVKVDVLGRLGSFGLSVMKTKADRMWDEFGQNLAKRIEVQQDGPGGPGSSDADVARPVAEPAAPTKLIAPTASTSHVLGVAQQLVEHEAVAVRPTPIGWWPRLLGALSKRDTPPSPRHIRIDLMRDGAAVTVHWPLEAAAECAALLRDCLRPATVKE
ncbi:CoxG family protein [Variovorax sp. KK3]|uniref:CoxG family protein n=1 Tax=Variovorax sp. KK3 TaxID=1855728 RepID=UPI00097CB7FC|nr:SRPBCC family protein [Variovorax sp. KK3]